MSLPSPRLTARVTTGWAACPKDIGSMAAINRICIASAYWLNTMSVSARPWKIMIGPRIIQLTAKAMRTKGIPVNATGISVFVLQVRRIGDDGVRQRINQRHVSAGFQLQVMVGPDMW